MRRPEPDIARLHQLVGRADPSLIACLAHNLRLELADADRSNGPIAGPRHVAVTPSVGPQDLNSRVKWGTNGSRLKIKQSITRSEHLADSRETAAELGLGARPDLRGNGLEFAERRGSAFPIAPLILQFGAGA